MKDTFGVLGFSIIFISVSASIIGILAWAIIQSEMGTYKFTDAGGAPVTCHFRDTNYCGLTLSECDDGNVYRCMVNIQIREGK